jgi:hypothetical protein
VAFGKPAAGRGSPILPFLMMVEVGETRITETGRGHQCDRRSGGCGS